MPTRQIVLEGHAAIDFLMTQAQAPLVGSWDGDTEKVGVVTLTPTGSLAVHWEARDALVAQLVERADREATLDHQVALRVAASDISTAEPDQTKCVVLMDGNVAVVVIPVEDLRAAQKFSSLGGSA